MIEGQITPLFPVLLELTGRLIVVVGGGVKAERIVLDLIDYGADILVISPSVTPALDALVAEGLIEHEARGYVRGDLAGAFIVMCATAVLEVARAVYQEAEGMGCLVLAPSAPELSNFQIEDIAIADDQAGLHDDSLVDL
ncbi:MAG: NAD(P)-dependent oxidoreductase [Actinomycetota bacterium]|nr:NAD(P)-dependent oxidoreductase [Actinomycetota bacterium]